MDTRSGQTFLDKTWRHLRQVWRGAAGNGRNHQSVSLQPQLPDEDLDQLRQWMRACLEVQGQEVSARARTAQLGHAYMALDAEGRRRFLQLLAEEFDRDDGEIEQAISAWRDAEGPRRVEARLALQELLDPPRMQLLKQFTELPEGVKFLVDMRAELLLHRRESPALAALEADLKRLLIHWFDVGLLNLERISWQSPAELLEKLIAYEAVHEIQSWEDLKNRLDSDRRCFAFFHPNMPGEPLIFVEVALVNGLADNIQQLLDEEAPLQALAQADTAIFYSISNAQQGLAGISFGNFLIKRVVGLLQQEFPALKQFATLSPIPGFSRWLKQVEDQQLIELLGNDTALPLLRSAQGESDWPSDPARAELLREPLQRLAAHYLARERKSDRRALDPVAHFHLSNGAEIAQLNWLADRSSKGLRQSMALMVNYRYDLARVESNSQQYLASGEAATGKAFETSLGKPAKAVRERVR
ncbi:malonyl-CoA decarboxylase [Marinobacterium arenosum]|uniref:malonyl-CoA decarboxylase n=1 Tax=Marinobacterium arenosum TaxID=2862496 RepID=UPI001C97C9CB|nr:malonyl-CoA decarboxylase [Marinobacterium arenosum]MBY4678330.1 malonyl-CoA decarboxylase [Marinobacterium arenosum]